MSTGTGAATDTAWQDAWQPVAEAVGRDFLDGEVTWGGDPVEAGSIRRYLEPLELDCALHTDRGTARAAGFDDVTMPYTGVMPWTLPAAWEPGQVLFDSDDRDAQPVRSAINDSGLGIGPRTTGFFGTDVEIDFLRPVVAGERLGRRGKRLLSCRPKETSVGRGAFMTWESEVVSDRCGDVPEVVGRIRIGTYAYVPHGARPAGEEQSR
ncbi:FAS1-like dehydratase domain-containing protein [Nocardioides campestrisoli]|uniref:FAS1-like dehydratase domain-containing protein n=1 Tax=Nocardioides campestrisoli TaxID=2736757 RepID=UPI0015E6DBBF|nr:MaoC family dehydratase N-terminal domain-containing protein [Nocardioides campestrisoli]